MAPMPSMPKVRPWLRLKLADYSLLESTHEWRLRVVIRVGISMMWSVTYQIASDVKRKERRWMQKVIFHTQQAQCG